METTPTIDLKNNEFNEFQFVQRFILATLYMSLDGNNWTNKTNWMTGMDLCLGMALNALVPHHHCRMVRQQLHVKNAICALILPNNQLYGTLPLEIVGLN
jgi:hypothetical protein